MPAVDPSRLARAVHLDVTEATPGSWTVSGGRSTHRVSKAQDGTVCDCVDSQVHPELVCKHRLAVRLSRLPPELRVGLRAIVPAG